MESRENTRPEKAGFTLVELVVVIAILGILAGVGAVAYGGYIEYTQKGLDRDSVGEIMHAIEVADYANPELFGDSGGAMAVLTKNGVQVAGATAPDEDGNVADPLKPAMEEALGSLNSIKLKYDEWSGSADMSVFADLGQKDGSQISGYLDFINQEEHKGLATSFADDMPEYWKAFEAVIRNINHSKDLSDGTGDGTHIEKIADYYNVDNNPNIVDATIYYWKHGQPDPNIELSGNGMQYLDVALAKNYSFASFARKQITDKKYLDQLDAYLSKNLDKLQLEDLTTLGMTDLTENKEDNEYWDEIRRKYNENVAQQEADARAYLGLMEAAGAVQQQLHEQLDTDIVYDEDFMNALSPYVGMVGNVLSGKVNLDAIRNLASVADGTNGSVIIISATKSNGVLSFDVSPADANPGTSGGSAGKETYAPTTSVDIPFANGDTTIYLNVRGTCAVSFAGSSYDSSNQRLNPKASFSPTGIAKFDEASGIITGETVGETTMTLTFSRYTYSIHIYVS